MAEVEAAAERALGDPGVRSAVFGVVWPVTERLGVEGPLRDRVAWGLAKQLLARLSGLSWLTIYDELVKVPRGVALRIAEALRGPSCMDKGNDRLPVDRLDELARRPAYVLGLGLSELVFGTTGLASAVRVVSVKVHADYSFIRWFNQVSQQEKGYANVGCACVELEKLNI